MEHVPLPSSKLDQALEKIEGLSTDDMRTLIALLEQKISESGNGNKTQGSLAIDSNETSKPLPIGSNEYNGIDVKDFEKLKISREEIRKLCAEWHELPPNSYLRADIGRFFNRFSREIPNLNEIYDSRKSYTVSGMDLDFVSKTKEAKLIKLKEISPLGFNVNPGSREGDADKLYYDWEMILELEPIILLQHGGQSIQTLHNRGGLGYDMLLKDMFCVRSVNEIESQINKYGGRKELLMKLGILKKLE